MTILKTPPELKRLFWSERLNPPARPSAYLLLNPRPPSLPHCCTSVDAINWKYCHFSLTEEEIENMDEGWLRVAVALMGNRKFDWSGVPACEVE